MEYRIDMWYHENSRCCPRYPQAAVWRCCNQKRQRSTADRETNVAALRFSTDDLGRTMEHHHDGMDMGHGDTMKCSMQMLLNCQPLPAQLTLSTDPQLEADMARVID